MSVAFDTRFHRAAHTARLRALLRLQWTWLAIGLVVAFVVPFVFADVLEVPRDLYYAVYVAAVAALVAAWVRCTGFDLGAAIRRRLPLTLALAAASAGVLVLVVMRESSTGRPSALTLVPALAWRGVVYGAADGVLLSAFPIVAVFAAFAARRAGRLRTAGVAALALAVSIAFTAVYHLGYSDFRSEKVRKPLAGDLIWSAPTLATLNPIGAPLAHVGLHVGAVLHSYETDVFLPPHAEQEGNSR
ncbi:MAG: hypothetical protein ACXWYS_04410 [Gaiellaceae bacterium]